MNSIRRFFSIFPATNITNTDKVIFIGRWSVPNNTNLHIDKIIDRNNEDHCGVCVSYEKDKIENEKNIHDDYYLAFIM